MGVMGDQGGTWSFVRMIWRNQPTNTLLGSPDSPIFEKTKAGMFAKYRVTLQDDGKLILTYKSSASSDKRELSWGLYLPEAVTTAMLESPVSFHVGTPRGQEAIWGL